MSFGKGSIGLLALTIFMLSASFSLADDCTPQGMKQEVVKAADLISKKGDAALEELKDFRFCGDQGYVFVEDLQGKMIFHPFLPHLVGKNVSAMKDANGKLFGLEILQEGKEKGESWVSYKWAKPGETTPADKCTYMLKTTLNGEEVLVGAGLYDIPESECGE